ncbi:hypothetical protein FJZ31_17055 [Candidatus Poribacteria bacterium]|nr:hypothetical protein [Candidatus Poribacteria bacterium]
MKRSLTIYSPEGDLWAELIYADGKISILRANPIYERGLQFALERDYDKTIITKRGIERLYAKKNSPEFLDALARFHEYNYGCKVTLIDMSEFTFEDKINLSINGKFVATSKANS